MTHRILSTQQDAIQQQDAQSSASITLGQGITVKQHGQPWDHCGLICNIWLQRQLRQQWLPLTS